MENKLAVKFLQIASPPHLKITPTRKHVNYAILVCLLACLCILVLFLKAAFKQQRQESSKNKKKVVLKPEKEESQ